MKKVLFALAMLFAASTAFSQKLAVNEVDEFVGGQTKRTSWELFYKFYKRGDGGMAHFRISKLDSLYYFEVKQMFQPSKVFSIHEGAKLLFILDDQSVYELVAVLPVVSSEGAGAVKLLGGSTLHGAHISYRCVHDRDFNILKEKLITKVRLYTSDGYAESEVKSKDAQRVINAIKLVE